MRYMIQLHSAAGDVVAQRHYKEPHPIGDASIRDVIIDRCRKFLELQGIQIETDRIRFQSETSTFDSQHRRIDSQTFGYGSDDGYLVVRFLD